MIYSAEGLGLDREVIIHHLMAVCGGLMGVYCIMARLGVFAAAETTNMIAIVCDILGRDTRDLILRLSAFIVYICGMISYTLLKKRFMSGMQYISLFVDLFAIIAMCMIPLSVEPFLALYPLFFATSFQWCAFQGARGYTCATIFSTNNLKQTVTSVTEYLTSKKGSSERRTHGDKALFFGGTLLCFHIGVAEGYLAYGLMGNNVILLCLLPMVVCLYLMRMPS